MENKKSTSLYETFCKYNALAEGDTKRIESKNRPTLTYLPWASAWQEVLKVDDDATYEVVPTATGSFIHPVGTGAMVVVQVTICGRTKKEYYPVESYAMQSITIDKITPTNVNKSIKRALVKCIAQFGLGLNLYIGEELTEGEKDELNDNISEMILKAETTDALLLIYQQNKDYIEKTPKIKVMFTARKNEILNKEKSKETKTKDK